jgi:MoxR-like ATPase
MNYRDLAGTVCTTTWDEVFASAKRIQEFFVAVRSRFAERDDLIRKVKYAFMMREHLLVDGPTGAGKSAVLNTIIDNIAGAEVWAMDLTKFTTDTMVFGAYDIKKMKEEGQTVHMTDGSLIEANFAKCGEFLDANDPLLRTLLGVMNERRVRRGPHEYEVPLISLVADTNFRIDDLPNRRQQLAAVLDRFLFQVSVEYVKDPRNRYMMLEMALETGKRPPLPPLHLDDVVRVSGVIIENDLVTDRYVREAYQEMTFDFSKARVAAGRAPLSDRRFAKAAHIMEVGAILHGRQACTFDDLQIAEHILVMHPDDVALFNAAKAATIDKWAVKAQRREIDVEAARLREITIEIPHPDVSALTYSDLQKLTSDLNGVLAKLGGFEPQSVEVRAEHTKTWTAIHDTLALIDLAMIARLVENIPKLPDSPDPATLHPLMRATLAVEAELRGISPRSDKARVELAKALEQAGHVAASIEVEFRGKRT